MKVDVHLVVHFHQIVSQKCVVLTSIDKMCSSSSLQWPIGEEILFILCIWLLLRFLWPLSTWVTWWWIQAFLRTIASLMVGKKSLVVLFSSLCVHSSFQFSFNLDKFTRCKREGKFRKPFDDAVDSCLIVIFAFWFDIEIPFVPLFSVSRNFMQPGFLSSSIRFDISVLIGLESDVAPITAFFEVLLMKQLLQLVLLDLSISFYFQLLKKLLKIKRFPFLLVFFFNGLFCYCLRCIDLYFPQSGVFEWQIR